MSISVLFTQLLILVLLIVAGFVAKKTKVVKTEETPGISRMISKIFGPSQILGTAMGLVGEKTELNFGTVMLIAVGMYIFYILFGKVVSIFLTKEKQGRNEYESMMIFANCGFVGIPVVRMVFGEAYLYYVISMTITYNLVLYTYGMNLMSAESFSLFSKKGLKRLINPGTVMMVIALIVLIGQIQIPYVISSVAGYLANATTALALMTVGFTLADMELRSFFTDVKMYIFIILKMLVMPIIMIFIMKPLPISPIIKGVYIVMAAMPVGNMPVVFAVENGRDAKMISRTVLLTTIFSVLTVPLVYFVYLNV